MRSQMGSHVTWKWVQAMLLKTPHEPVCPVMNKNKVTIFFKQSC